MTDPHLRAALIEMTRRDVADGNVTVETARQRYPEVTDWPAPATEHKRELVAHLRRSTYPDAFAYGYLRHAVVTFLDGDATADELRARLADIDAARKAVRS